MTREESETVIRRLVEEWLELRGVTEGQSGRLESSSNIQKP